MSSTLVCRSLLSTCLVVLLFCLAEISFAQQNPHGKIPVTTLAEPYLFLIRDPVVHDDLNLTAAQRKSVGALSDELDAALWPMRNKSAQHIAQTMRQATETAKARLASILSPDQTRRVAEIELRTLGTKAFLGDQLPEKLGLTEQQTTDIRQTIAETGKALAELRNKLAAGEPRAALESQSRRLRTDEQKQIIALLNDRQRRAWIALLGESIDVEKLGRVKFKAPELLGQDGWLGTSPLTLRQLKGKVVALHFFAFG